MQPYCLVYRGLLIALIAFPVRRSANSTNFSRLSAALAPVVDAGLDFATIFRPSYAIIYLTKSYTIYEKTLSMENRIFRVTGRTQSLRRSRVPPTLVLAAQRRGEGERRANRGLGALPPSCSQDYGRPRQHTSHERPDDPAVVVFQALSAQHSVTGGTRAASPWNEWDQRIDQTQRPHPYGPHGECPA